MTDSGIAVVVASELMSYIESAIANHPRSLQKAIGPSECGEPCERALIHKLAGHDEPERGDGWLATVGTAVHTYMADVVIPPHNLFDSPRYLVEHEVCVGEINGVEVTGHADLFDIDAGYVIDWKVVGATPLQDYKRKGPRPEYFVQPHLYGRGFARQGYTVNGVLIMFLPRNGELRTRYEWSMDYDEKIAVDALERATGLAQLIDMLGVQATLDMHPPCEDRRNCGFCIADFPIERKPAPTTTRDLFKAALAREK